MSSAREKLESKLSEHESEKQKRNHYFIEIAGPLITWAAIGVTYSSLRSDFVTTVAWGAVMLSLLALQIGLAGWKARNG